MKVRHIRRASYEMNHPFSDRLHCQVSPYRKAFACFPSAVPEAAYHATYKDLNSTGTTIIHRVFWGLRD